MDKLVVYPDGTDKPGVEFPIANGFVARVVGAVAENNIPDAQRVAAILNKKFEECADPHEDCGDALETCSDDEEAHADTRHRMLQAIEEAREAT